MATRTTVRIVIGCAAALCVASATGAAGAAELADFRAARAMERLDTSRDGTLSIEEYRAGARKGQADNAARNFKKIDKDNDGKVTAAELRDGWAAANNVLREAVWRADEVSRARTHEAAFAALDKNGDDFVSLDEFTAGSREKADGVRRTFLKIDDNRDGKVHRTELADAWPRVRDTIRNDLYAPGAADPSDAKGASRAPSSAPAKSSEAPRSEEDDESGGDVEDDEADHPEDGEGRGGDRARGPDAARVFRELDTDNDGGLTLAEFRAGVPEGSRGEADKHFKKMDRDKDGAVAGREFHSGWLHGKRMADKKLKGKDKEKGKDKGKDKGKRDRD